jgi:hypothetical protein
MKSVTLLCELWDTAINQIVSWITTDQCPFPSPKNVANLEAYQYIMVIQLDVLFNSDIHFIFCPIYLSI